MALTAKPISTISYNTEQFLERKLEQMFKANIIVDYRWIKHFGEDGDKDHVHIILYPNKRIDTGALREEFNEITTDEKPLGVLPFRTSKDDHWLMYVLHDPEYLKAHQSDNDGDGKIPYEISDVKTPFPEQLARDFKKALALRKTKNQEVIERLVVQHQSVTEVIYQTGINPMTVATIYNALQHDQAKMETEAMEKQREQIRSNAAKLTGTVTEEEELPQLKVESKQGIVSKRVKEYRMNLITGELEPIDKGIIQQNEDESEEPW